MSHFNYILCDRFIDVLFECGEKMSKARVIKLFKGYNNTEKFERFKVCVYMYVCVFICMYECVYVCMYMYMYMWASCDAAW